MAISVPIQSQVTPPPRAAVTGIRSNKANLSAEREVDVHGMDRSRTNDVLRKAQKRIRATKILTDATRDFGKISRPSIDEINRFKELFYQLIDKVRTTDRRLISAMLARAAFTPRSVALYFSQDTLEIAAPFLLFSSVLGDRDLRAIAAKKGPEYAEIIKKRRLPMDAYTLQQLETPKNTQSEFIEVPASIDTQKSTADDKWLSGDEILALASVGGRLGKDTKQAADPVTLDNKISRSKDTFEAKEYLPKQEVRNLMRFARMNDLENFSAQVLEISGLDTNSTLRLLNSNSGDELAYLIKALGVPAPHNIQMMLLLAPRYGRNIDNYRKLKQLINELDFGICRMIFNEIGAKFDLRCSSSAPRPIQIETPASGKNDFQAAVRGRREMLNEEGRYKISTDMGLMAAG